MEIVDRLRRGTARLAAAGRQYGESPVKTAARALWLRASLGVNLERGFLTGMTDPRISPPRRGVHPGGRDFPRLLKKFNPQRDELVDDKTIFAARCAGYGLPAPKLFAITTPDFGLAADGRVLGDAAAWRRFLLEELPPEFIVKPSESWCGQNVEAFTRDGDGFKSGGRRLSADDLHRRLIAESVYGRAVIQERLSNHPALAEFSPSRGLQTVRLVTVVGPTGEVEFMFAFLKIILGAGVTDNFLGGAAGNLVAQADLRTGELGVALGPGPERIGTSSPLDHPVTGRPIAGFRLPDWDKLASLARLAAIRFLPMRAIAWDIALTPEGPKLVEGNTAWGPYCGRGFWFEAEQFARLRALL